MDRYAFRLTFLLSGLALFSLSVAGCGGSGVERALVIDHSIPQGVWGGGQAGTDSSLATLHLTASSGHFDFYCGEVADFTQPLTPDATGRFDVAGTSHFGFTPPSPTPTRITGTVTDQKMTVTFTETFPNGTQGVEGPFTLVFGQAAPPMQGVCPG
jgi:hypothetical protein